VLGYDEDRLSAKNGLFMSHSVSVTYSAHEWTGTHVGDDATLKKLMMNQDKAFKSVQLFYDYNSHILLIRVAFCNASSDTV